MTYKFLETPLLTNILIENTLSASDFSTDILHP
jgi:hypothetical protein